MISGTVLVAQIRYHQAPQSVRESVNKEYPNADNVSWSISSGQWNASFKDRDHGKMVARYNKYGSHLDSRIPYTKRDVPDPVKETVKKRYPHSRDLEYTKIQRNHGSDEFYRVKLRDHGKDQYVYMDADGHRRKY